MTPPQEELERFLSFWRCKKKKKQNQEEGVCNRDCATSGLCGGKKKVGKSLGGQKSPSKEKKVGTGSFPKLRSLLYLDRKVSFPREGGVHA